MLQRRRSSWPMLASWPRPVVERFQVWELLLREGVVPSRQLLVAVGLVMAARLFVACEGRLGACQRRVPAAAAARRVVHVSEHSTRGTEAVVVVERSALLFFPPLGCLEGAPGELRWKERTRAARRSTSTNEGGRSARVLASRGRTPPRHRPGTQANRRKRQECDCLGRGGHQCINSSSARLTLSILVSSETCLASSSHRRCLQHRLGASEHSAFRR